MTVTALYENTQNLGISMMNITYVCRCTIVCLFKAFCVTNKHFSVRFLKVPECYDTVFHISNQHNTAYAIHNISIWLFNILLFFLFILNVIGSSFKNVQRTHCKMSLFQGYGLHQWYYKSVLIISFLNACFWKIWMSWYTGSSNKEYRPYNKFL